MGTFGSNPHQPGRARSAAGRQQGWHKLALEIEPFTPDVFDRWANTYDQSVLDENHFPFIGYRQTLKTVARLADAHPGIYLLDIGTGTGNLAKLFAELGCFVWATDFSATMLAEARRKLPQAEYVQADIRQSWPMALPPVFELIVSAYVFHHFNLPEKISICADLIEHLTPNGKLILADIAFSNQASMEEFRTMQMDEWEEEFYWLADEAIPAFKQVNMHAVFTPASICSGVFEVDKL